jgi:hypothetical protein
LSAALGWPTALVAEEVAIESGFVPWHWVGVLRVLLCASAFFYAVSLLPLLAGRPGRNPLHPTVFEKLLGSALVCHVAFTICRSWLAGRPPFFGRVELLSWFAFCCGALCFFGSNRFSSKFVIVFGVSCAFATTLALGISYRAEVLPGIFALRDIRAWWYGLATPLGYAAGVLAFAAQLRGILAIAQGTKPGGVSVFPVSEEAMNSLALSLVRFCYPFVLSGLLAFAIGSLDSVGRAWFWQRSIAAQLFALVAYSVYMHLSTSVPVQKSRIIVAQFAAFSGVLVSVLSFELPQGFLRGLGLGLFL